MATTTDEINTIETCDICTEKYNHRRKSVVCEFCAFKCCNSCFKDFALASTETDLRCVSCLHPINDIVLYSSGLYKHKKAIDAHRGNILFEQKKHLLTKLDAEVETKIEIISNSNYIRICKDKIKEYRKWIKDEQARIRDFEQTNAQLRMKQNMGFKQHCPKCENGVIGANNKCHRCDAIVCGHCECVIDFTTEHVCNEDAVSSINEIKQNTQACPNCHTRIHKIAFCNDMFCTRCQTKFSYLTGKRIFRTIHNPHQPNAPLDECNPIAPPSVDMLRSLNLGTDIYAVLSSIWDSIQRRLDTYTTNISDYESDGEKSLLVNKLVYRWSDDFVKEKMFKHYRSYKDNIRWAEIYTTYKDIFIECLWKLYDKDPNVPKEDILEFIKDLIDWKHKAITNVRPNQFDYQSAIYITTAEKYYISYDFITPV